MSEWIDRSVLEAASWRLASELVRRHPDSTRILRTHPGDGMYDCLTIVSTENNAGTIQLNREGTIQVSERFDDAPGDEWEPTAWDDYLRADPRDFLVRLERASGLLQPSHVPPAVPMTLTYRVLAALASTAFKSIHRIEIQPGYIDTSGYGSGPNTALDAFSSIPADLLRAHDGDLLGEPGYRFWVLLRDDTPILAFEQKEGMVWSRHDAAARDLMDMYRHSNRNVLSVVFELFRAADKI